MQKRILGKKGQGDVEITPAMIKAGVEAYERAYESTDYPTIDQLVEEVFRKMHESSRS